MTTETEIIPAEVTISAEEDFRLDVVIQDEAGIAIDITGSGFGDFSIDFTSDYGGATTISFPDTGYTLEKVSPNIVRLTALLADLGAMTADVPWSGHLVRTIPGPVVVTEAWMRIRVVRSTAPQTTSEIGGQQIEVEIV